MRVPFKATVKIVTQISKSFFGQGLSQATDEIMRSATVFCLQSNEIGGLTKVYLGYSGWMAAVDVGWLAS